MNKNGDFDRFLANRNPGGPQRRMPAGIPGGTPGMGGFPPGYSGPPGGIQLPPGYDPNKDPRIPLLGQCPNGCKGMAIQYALPVPMGEGATMNAKARCIECLCWWEVTPLPTPGNPAPPEIVNLLTFEHQVANAMMKIRSGLEQQQHGEGGMPA